MKDVFNAILSDPKTQKVWAAFQPAAAILRDMFARGLTDQAMQTAEDFLGEKRADAVLELKRNATAEQWQAFQAATVAAGSEYVLDDLESREAFWAKIKAGMLSLLLEAFAGAVA